MAPSCIGFDVKRVCSICGFAVFAALTSAVNPYHGYAVAAPGSASELGIPSEPLTAVRGVPYHASVSRPLLPACAQSNSFVATPLEFTRTGADQLWPWSVENE